MMCISALVGVVAKMQLLMIAQAARIDGGYSDAAAHSIAEPGVERFAAPALAQLDDDSTLWASSSACCCMVADSCSGKQQTVYYASISGRQESFCCKDAYSECGGSWLFSQGSKYSMPLLTLMTEERVPKRYDPSTCRKVPSIYDPVRRVYDIRLREDLDLSRLWVCDIKERPGEGDNDFLFMGDISDSGAASGSGWKQDDVCIFQDVMYDIQSFTPDFDDDGMLDFRIDFGKATAERKGVPNGWHVDFKNLRASRDRKSWHGIVHTSWWGDRDVILFNYLGLSKSDLRRYPDPVVEKYYKSL